MTAEVDWPALFACASQARARAYAPYSNLRVGAGLMARSGEIFAGCNIESASYGLTICAERSAMAGAITAGEKEFVALAIVGGSRPISPCGACPEALMEFGDSISVCSRGDDGTEAMWTLSELLPHPFAGFREH